MGFRRAGITVLEDRTRERGGTYGFLPFFENTDEDDDVWDVTVFGWVHLVKVEG